MLGAVLVDGVVDPAEREMLSQFARENGLGEAQIAPLLARAGWSVDEYREGSRRP